VSSIFIHLGFYRGGGLPLNFFLLLFGLP
jgi:hypothetical protein